MILKGYHKNTTSFCNDNFKTLSKWNTNFITKNLIFKTPTTTLESVTQTYTFPQTWGSMLP